MGFKSSHGDPDIWNRASGKYYHYIGFHTDDFMDVSHDCKSIYDGLPKDYVIKNIGPPKYHLGVNDT